MGIRVEQLPWELKNEVVRIGGECEYYEELDDCFAANFYHHELETQGAVVIVTDDLTGYSSIFKRIDYYQIILE